MHICNLAFEVSYKGMIHVLEYDIATYMYKYILGQVFTKHEKGDLFQRHICTMLNMGSPPHCLLKKIVYHRFTCKSTTKHAECS